MTDQELKEFLDFKSEQYENSAFISSDPIQLPHRFERKEDIEIIAFLVSTIAWGTRKGIISSGENEDANENAMYSFTKTILEPLHPHLLTKNTEEQLFCSPNI